MPEKLIPRLMKEGKLKKQEVGIIQVEEMLRQSLRDLHEASKICNIAETATYIMAYNGMLKAGRALLLLNGLTPDDGAQHKTVVEVTSSILGPKFRKITAHFEIMRKKRNELTYDAGIFVTSTESQLAFHDAMDLVKGILDKAKSQDPQLELEFEV